MRTCAVMISVSVVFAIGSLRAQPPPTSPQSTGSVERNAHRDQTSAARSGYRLLRTKTYLPPDFDRDVFESLWKVWPEPLRSQARDSTPAQRRHMAFSRYGLMQVPGNQDESRPALGYVDDGKDGWVMNCLACHAGKVAGRVIPGLPNTHFALQTLTEEVRLTKISLFKPLGHLDLVSLNLPLGTTHGTTNSVIFGVVLGTYRDRDLNIDQSRPLPKLVHHDMDPPPFWNVKKKDRLYADGFSPKNHRVLMQFILLPANGPKTIKSWEDDFQNILAWTESLEPPPYPWTIDRNRAESGKVLFRKHCSRCHGTYGQKGQYRQQTIPINVVGTDPVRLQALSTQHRWWLRNNWMSHYGRDQVIVNPMGYVAPPLDGIWASAPYLHNGSVPTLWHLLHPDERPKVWKRTEDGYDREKVGLEVVISNKVPATVRTAAARRNYFDTTRSGKSAAGHRFPDVLSEDEKWAVIEFLKTL